MTQPQTLILGSSSPQRREILEYFSVSIMMVPPHFDEDSIPYEGNPHDYVCELSRGKAASLVDRYPSQVILSADTIVICDGKLFTKPKDEADALRILKELAGSWHTVITGIVVRKGEKEYVGSEETGILFHDITEEQIKKYHDQLYCLDKAGGYAIQMSGSIIVKKIDGCFYNVMGLPIYTTQNLLSQAGINLWDHLV